MSDALQRLMEPNPNWVPPTPEEKAARRARRQEREARELHEAKMTALLLSAAPGPYGPH